MANKVSVGRDFPIILWFSTSSINPPSSNTQISSPPTLRNFNNWQCH